MFYLPLILLGYENVKITPVHPEIRQELGYLDREVGLVIYSIHQIYL